MRFTKTLLPVGHSNITETLATLSDQDSGHSIRHHCLIYFEVLAVAAGAEAAALMARLLSSSSSLCLTTSARAAEVDAPPKWGGRCLCRKAAEGQKGGRCLVC